MPNFICRNFGGGNHYPFMKSVTLCMPVVIVIRVQLEAGGD